MWQATWRWGWRGVLISALAIAPWPTTAWSLDRDTDPVADMPCHAAAVTPTADTAEECELDCCTDPACDPGRCLLLQAAFVVPAWPNMMRARPDETRFALRDNPPPAPPPAVRLRPPIH